MGKTKNKNSNNKRIGVQSKAPKQYVINNENSINSDKKDQNNMDMSNGGHHQSIMEKIRSAIEHFLFGHIEERLADIDSNLDTSIETDIQNLNKEIEQISESVKDVNSQVTNYVNQISSLHNKNKELQDQNQRQQNQISDLGKEKDALQKDNSKLNSSKDELSREKDRIEKDYNLLKNQHNSLKIKHDASLNENRKKYDEGLSSTRDEAFAQGKEAGMAEGKAKGISEGRSLAEKDFMGQMASKFNKIVSDTDMTPEYAMGLIAGRLDDLDVKLKKVDKEADDLSVKLEEANKKIKLLETTTDVGAFSLQLDEEKKKVEELEGNLQNEKNNVQQLSETIKTKDSELEALESKIKTEEEEWGKKRDEYIENEKNLKQKHDDEVNQLKSEHQNEMSKVRSDYENQTAQLNTQMAEQKKSYEDKIEKELQQHENEINDLKSKQRDKIEQINSDHASKVKEMEEQHELAVNQLNDSHRAEVDKLNQEHDNKIAQLNLSLKREQDEKKKVSDTLTNETEQAKQSTKKLAQQLLEIVKHEDVVLSCGDFDEIAKEYSDELVSETQALNDSINNLGVTSTPSQWGMLLTKMMAEQLEKPTSLVNRVMKYYCLSSLPFMIDSQRESGMYFNRKQIKKMYNIINAILEQCGIKVHIPALFVENVRDDDYETDNTFNDVETFCPGGIKEHVRYVERDDDGKQGMIVGVSRIGYSLPDGTVVKTKVIV